MFIDGECDRYASGFSKQNRCNEILNIQKMNDESFVRQNDFNTYNVFSIKTIYKDTKILQTIFIR